MIEWEISNQDIESTEKLLLPKGAHFPEDARNVIRCWHSADVAACRVVEKQLSFSQS
ncbi:MAG: hypothetical protein ACLRWH_07280 [Emergencia sp.]